MNDYFKSKNDHLIHLYKTIYEFFEIYKLTSQSNVFKWTLNDLNNCLKWSKYIQEICSKIKLNKLEENIELIKSYFLKEEETQAKDILLNSSILIMKVNCTANKVYQRIFLLF